MDGERNLTHHNVRNFGRGLGLGEREQLYFENLVFFNQSDDEQEKAFYRKNLENLRAQDDRTLLTKDQFEVYSTWYPLAIKELLLISGMKTLPKQIARRFDHRFTPQQAKEALNLLLRLGLIKETANGSYKVTQQSMQTPNLAKSSAIAKFHQEMVEMVKEAVDRQSAQERCLSALTVAVRKKDLPEAFRRIHRFRNEMDAFFGKGKPYDSVYQLNLQLIRLDRDED